MVELLMMSSGIAAIYYVVIWSIRNEKARTLQEQTGLLRMRAPEGNQAPDAGRTRDRTRAAGARGGRRRQRPGDPVERRRGAR